MKKFKIPKDDQFIKKISIAIGILIFLIILGSFSHNMSEHGTGFKESIIYTVSIIAHTNLEEVHNSYLYLTISLLDM